MRSHPTWEAGCDLGGIDQRIDQHPRLNVTEDVCRVHYPTPRGSCSLLLKGAHDRYAIMCSRIIHPSNGQAVTDEFRLDELARRAEVASTTVRLYRNRGLLPPPRLVGRTGWYDAGHLNRLRLITRLQSQGFSLSGIRELLDQWEQGRSLDAMLGVEDQLGALLGEPQATTIAPSELASQFPDNALTVELMQRATELGLVEILDQDTVRVADRRFIGAGATLAHLGIPLAEILDEWQALRSQTDLVADRFIGLFERHLVPDEWRTDLSTERAKDLADVLAQLRATAQQVLAAALDASIAGLGRERLAELLPEG